MSRLLFALSWGLLSFPIPMNAGAKELDEVLVVGSRERLATLAGAADIIDSLAIRDTRAYTINELLRQVPGVQARDEEGFGLRPNVGIRGLNPTRSTKVLLLEDGLPLTFAPYGDNASYYHPPVERFERIEVLKGASQVAFGPHTVGGVINYLTGDIPAEFAGRLIARAGSPGYHDVDVQAGDTGARSGWYASGAHKQSDGARDNMRCRVTDAFG